MGRGGGGVLCLKLYVDCKSSIKRKEDSIELFWKLTYIRWIGHRGRDTTLI